jgi:hypothetical protein
MKLQYFSYRFAQEVLDSTPYRPLLNEIIAALQQTQVPQRNVPKTQPSSGKTFSVDQVALNKLIETQMASRAWELYPLIVSDKGTQLKADYKKNRVQVEVQFGNMARAIYDLFKLQVSYAQDLIDVGVIVVAMQTFANQIDSNVAHFERLVRELKYAKMSITLPILIVGVAP